jgi:hypothetical protein
VQSTRGADHLHRSVGLFQFALEFRALLGEAVEVLSKSLEPRRVIRGAMSVDQAAQLHERAVEPAGDVGPGVAERALLC